MRCPLTKGAVMSAHMRLSHYPSDEVLKREWFAFRCSYTSFRARLMMWRIGRMRSEIQDEIAVATQLLGPSAPCTPHSNAACNTAGLLTCLRRQAQNLLKDAESLARRSTLPLKQCFDLEDAASELRELAARASTVCEELVAKYKMP